MILRPDHQVDKVLRASGWFPGRRVEAGAWISQLVREGFVEFPPVRNLLEELGGLKIDPPERDDQAFIPHPFDFLPLEAGSGQRDVVERWERLVGTQLFPLGSALKYMTLLAAADGRILLGETSYVYLAGSDIDDALEVLIEAKRQPTLLSRI